MKTRDLASVPGSGASRNGLEPSRQVGLIGSNADPQDSSAVKPAERGNVADREVIARNDWAVHRIISAAFDETLIHLECAIEIKFQSQSLGRLVSSRSGGEDETPRMIASPRCDQNCRRPWHIPSHFFFTALPMAPTNNPVNCKVPARVSTSLASPLRSQTETQGGRRASNQAAMSNHAHPRRQS